MLYWIIRQKNIFFILDVNECLTNNGGCDSNAACSNTDGGSTCTCNSGYTGVGTTCTGIRWIWKQLKYLEQIQAAS